MGYPSNDELDGNAHDSFPLLPAPYSEKGSPTELVVRAVTRPLWKGEDGPLASVLGEIRVDAWEAL